MTPGMVEPRLGAESFSCPHCRALAHQTWYHVWADWAKKDEKFAVFKYEQFDANAITRIKDERERQELVEFLKRLQKNSVTYRVHQYADARVEMFNLHLSRCFSCDGFAVWVEDKLTYPIRQSQIVAHDEMPPGVREDFEEAASIVNASPRGAAALLRLCIQKLMPALGESGDSINDAIGSLVTKGLEVEIQQALDVVRVIGNNAVHPGQIDLKDDRDTAITLFELVNIIVERRIAVPNRIDRLFSNLPPSARKAIEKRDGPKGGKP